VQKVILYIAASLDGFIARPDGDVSWLDKYNTGGEDYGYRDFYKSVGACIMGSRTYEKALTLDGGIDNQMPTYVVTRRPLGVPAGSDITFYQGNLTKLVETVKAKTGKAIWLVGGGQLAQSFLKERLVNDIILSTIPVILGEGITLFGSMKEEVNFRVIRSESFETGIVQTHYVAQPAGGENEKGQNNQH
jgi:dihydrofolate reductase